MSFPVPLSLCITTMNRWEFLEKNLPKYLESSYINEIVISDENGNDVKKIQETFSSPKLKLFVNETRQGVYKNKLLAIRRATNEWTCLIDSDNFAPDSYFEACTKVFQDDKSIVYSPERTLPHGTHPGFDFRRFSNTFVDRTNFKKVYRHNGSGNVLLNCMNYIISKSLVQSLQGNPSYEAACKALDSAYINYLIFQQNGRIFVVPGMAYEHVVHPGSNYLLEVSTTDVKRIEQLYQ